MPPTTPRWSTAFIRVAEATGEPRWLREATSTADALLDAVLGHENGGFFTTGDDAESLVTRPKDLLDNATPSANSLAAVALLRLAARHAVSSAIASLRSAYCGCFVPAPAEHPMAFANTLAAIDLHTTGVTEIVIAGRRPDLVEVVHRAVPTERCASHGANPTPLRCGKDASAMSRMLLATIRA